MQSQSWFQLAVAVFLILACLAAPGGGCRFGPGLASPLGSAAGDGRLVRTRQIGPRRHAALGTEPGRQDVGPAADLLSAVRRAEHDRRDRSGHRRRQADPDRPGLELPPVPGGGRAERQTVHLGTQRAAAAENLPLRPGHERVDARRRRDARRDPGRNAPAGAGHGRQAVRHRPASQPHRDRRADRSRHAAVKAYGRSAPATSRIRAGAIPAGPTTASSTSPAARSRGTWWPTTGRRASRRRWPRPGRVGGMVSVGQRPDGCIGSASGIVEHRRRASRLLAARGPGDPEGQVGPDSALAAARAAFATSRRVPK